MHRFRDSENKHGFRHRASGIHVPEVLAVIAVIFLFATTQGCGGSGAVKNSAPYRHVSTESIRGEVIEVLPASSEEKVTGIVGSVLIEGSRSQVVEEALVTVTGSTRIVDRRGENDIRVGIDAIATRQTVEASFRVLQNAPHPHEALEIVICP